MKYSHNNWYIKQGQTRSMWLVVILMMLPAVFTSAAESTPSGFKGTGLAEYAEPAGFTVDGIQYGIASKYIRDRGIKNDPDVIFAEDFEVAEVKDLETRGWVPRWGPGRWETGKGEKRGWKYYEITAEPEAAFTGKSCLKKSVTPNPAEKSNGPWGAKATWDLPQGHNVIFVRTYVKLSTKLPTGSTPFRILGITGVPDGQPSYQTYGANTPQCDGTGPFWIDLSLRNLQRYGVRHLIINSRKTNTSYVLYGTENRLPANRWLCIEMKVKLNTPGKRDGELRVWLDGTEVFRHPRMWYRDLESVKIRSVHDQFKSDRLYFTTAGTFWVDNLVVARSYIGPAVDTELRTAPPTLYPAPQADRTSPVTEQTSRGIAASYPGDQGIAKDPDVLFVEDFEDADWHTKWQERSKGHRKYGSLEMNPNIVLTGNNSLKLLLVSQAGPDGAGWMHYWWDGAEKAYLRYYVRLSKGGDWGNQKIMQLHGHKPGVRFGGGAGNRGIDWLCAGDGVGGSDGPPWRKNILYNYHPHQAGGFGDVLNHTVPDPPPAEEERWICKEIMIKLNDPGKLNGEVRKWVDGRLVIEKTDMEWRLEPDIVINNIMQPTYTGTPPKPGKQRTLWLDNIVLAKRYIGPISTPP